MKMSNEEVSVFRDRLMRLADVLRNDVSDEQYYHGAYRRTTEPHCGTVGCALGHAAARPEAFPGLGLGFVQKHYGWCITAPATDNDDEVAAANRYFGPGAYWEIFSEGAYHDEKRYPTRAEVIERIEEFAAALTGAQQP
jgi:hypothetical protein